MQKLTTQLARWDDRLALRLPAELIATMGLREGEELEIEVASSGRHALIRRPRIHDLLARLRKYRGSLPADFRFDRQQAQDGRRG